MNKYDLVYRDDIIDAVKKNIPHAIFDDYGNYTVRGMRLLDVISDVPVAQPECKKGWWVEMGVNADKTHNIVCSKCGEGYKTKGHAKSIATRAKWKFCPSCGADMRGESDETICD